MWYKFISFIVVLHLCTFHMYAQNIRELRTTGEYKQTNITELLNDIETKLHVQCFYDIRWFNNQIIDVSFSNTPLLDALDKTLNHTPYLYDIIQDKYIVFFPKEDAASFTGKQGFLTDDITDFNTKIIGSSSDAGKYKKTIIKGKMYDAKSAEPIISGTVLVKNTKIITNTDINGFFSLILPPGVYQLNFSKMGYESSTEKIKVISSGVLNIEMFEKVLEMDELIVNGVKANHNVSSNQMSIIELDAKAIKELPSNFGEKDIIKGMKAMPGIKSIGEFGSGINVRGSSGDQNLFIVEDAPLFNTSHIFGLTSVINSDAVSGVSLYKGNIPAQFGERISSVMDIQLKEGDLKKYHVNGGLGIINSRLTIEGPILNDSSTSFLISGRTTYSDWLLRRMPDLDLQNSQAGFYDINASVNSRINAKNKLSIFAYRSNDAFSYNKIVNYSYSNMLGSFKWIHTLNSKCFATLTGSYSKYQMLKKDEENEYAASQTKSDITYKNIKLNINYIPVTKHNINIGIQGIQYVNHKGELTPVNNSIVIPKKLPTEQSVEGAAYISEKYDISNTFSLNAGIRFSGYAFLGPHSTYQYAPAASKNLNSITDTISYTKNKVIQKYMVAEPRLSLKYQVNQTGSFKLSYNRNAQYISLISYTSIPTPDDIWKLSDAHVKPAICQQVAFGFFKNMKKNTIETSAEIYYKAIDNLIEYKNAAILTMNATLETELIQAHGENYGIEIYAKKKSGKLNGYACYTYSRSYKKTNGVFSDEIINGNNYYPSSYDMPHDFTLVGNYQPNKIITLTCNFSYCSGRAITLPEYKYQYGSYWIIQFSDRNKYRLPSYNRLDISITLNESLRKAKKWKGSWTLAIMNVYGRKNAYSIYYKKENPSFENNFDPFSLYKLYFIGMPFPTLTYNFNF